MTSFSLGISSSDGPCWCCTLSFGRLIFAFVSVNDQDVVPLDLESVLFSAWLRETSALVNVCTATLATRVADTPGLTSSSTCSMLLAVLLSVTSWSASFPSLPSVRSWGISVFGVANRAVIVSIEPLPLLVDAFASWGSASELLPIRMEFFLV